MLDTARRQTATVRGGQHTVLAANQCCHLASADAAAAAVVHWHAVTVTQDAAILDMSVSIAKGQIPLRYPGRRSGFRPGLRQFRAGLRPARDFFGSKAGRRQVRAISTCHVSTPPHKTRTGLRPAFDPKKVASWSQTRTNLSETWSETASATKSVTWTGQRNGIRR